MFRKIQAILLSASFLIAICAPPVRSATLTWTAVGDDGMEGTADHYILKGSTDRTLLENNFWECDPQFCIEISGLPAPKPAGSIEIFEIPDGIFPSGSVVYFRIVAVDEAGNAGEPSNIAVKNMPDIIAPASIFDLR